MRIVSTRYPCNRQMLSYKYTDDEIQMSTALNWLAEFIHFAQDVILPFTPRLIPAILPNLAHHVLMIQKEASAHFHICQICGG